MDWHAIDWRKAHAHRASAPSSYRQPRFDRWEAASLTGGLNGLSCLRGNSHEQFLGGGVAVTSPCYPAWGAVMLPGYPTFTSRCPSTTPASTPPCSASSAPACWRGRRSSCSLRCCSPPSATPAYLRARGRQRSDSTHVLAKVRALNRLECVGATFRHALNCLAVVAPDWLVAHSPPAWLERYGARFVDDRLPESKAEREELGDRDRRRWARPARRARRARGTQLAGSGPGRADPAPGLAAAVHLDAAGDLALAHE